MSKRKKQLSKRTKRPSRHVTMAAAIAKDWAHQSSEAINSKRRLLEVEAQEAAFSIATAEANLRNAKARLTELEALIEGLASVVDRR